MVALLAGLGCAQGGAFPALEAGFLTCTEGLGWQGSLGADVGAAHFGIRYARVLGLGYFATDTPRWSSAHELGMLAGVSRNLDFAYVSARAGPLLLYDGEEAWESRTRRPGHWKGGLGMEAMGAVKLWYAGVAFKVFGSLAPDYRALGISGGIFLGGGKTRRRPRTRPGG